MYKVSIITATFNSSKYIESAIESVNSQSYDFIEHIFIDGLSSDDTLEKISTLSKRDPKVISEKDSGIYDALNKGLLIASGDIIGLLHSDDFFPSTKIISLIINKFIEDPTIDIIYGDLEYVSRMKTDKVVRTWKSEQFTTDKLMDGWMPPHPTLFIRKEIYKKFGNFNTSYQIAADYDFILRVLKNDKLIAKHVSEVFTKMRVGGISNRSLGRIIKKSSEDFSIMKYHQLPIWRCFFGKNISKISQFFKQ